MSTFTFDPISIPFALSGVSPELEYNDTIPSSPFNCLNAASAGLANPEIVIWAPIKQDAAPKLNFLIENFSFLSLFIDKPLFFIFVF